MSSSYTKSPNPRPVADVLFDHKIYIDERVGDHWYADGAYTKAEARVPRKYTQQIRGSINMGN